MGEEFAPRDESAIEHLSTREGYNRWSSIYDSDGNPLIALEEPLVDRLLGDIAGLDIIDLGCGTGRHALRLATAGAKVQAVDFSEQMLARARQKSHNLNVEFHSLDLTQQLPFGNEAFDRQLRARNPEWGVRNLEDAALLAEAQSFELQDTYDMPANNLSVVSRKR